MDWKSLNKDQKQMAALAVLAAFTFLYVGITFILKPMQEKMKVAKKDIKELAQQVKTAETFNSQDKTVVAAIEKNYKNLAGVDKQFLADEQNTFDWALEKASAVGREVGVELAISSVGVSGRSQGSATSIAHFVPYSINVNTECSYDQLVVLLKKFENISPYTSIGNLTIISSSSNYTKHAVSFRVQWPLFQNPNKRNKIIKT